MPQALQDSLQDTAAAPKLSPRKAAKQQKKELARLREQARAQYGTPRQKGSARVSAKKVISGEADSAVMRSAFLNRQSKKSLRYAVSETLKRSAVNMALVALSCALIALFLIAAMQEHSGDFTITLDRRDMAKYGLALSASADFQNSGARLNAEPLVNATNISETDLPADVTEIDGTHNGKNYLAYTFYIRNNGKEATGYKWSIRLESVTRNVDAAVRVAVYYNDNDRVVYAKPAQDGTPEPDTIPFVSDTVVQVAEVVDLKVDSTDRYTVLMWLEGDDPDCVDALIGGSIKMGMDLSVLGEDAEEKKTFFEKLF